MKFKSTFTSCALQNLKVLWNKRLVLYVTVLFLLKKFVWFILAKCKVVLYFLILTDPPFKLNAFDATGPKNLFNTERVKSCRRLVQNRWYCISNE